MGLGGRDRSAMIEWRSRRWAEWPNSAPMTGPYGLDGLSGP